jgi:hypothetical protein
MIHSLIEAGVSAGCAAVLTSRAKPAVRLETFKVESQDNIQIGATKIGGWPDLPRDMPWPMRPPYPDAEERKAVFADIVHRLRSTESQFAPSEDTFAPQVSTVGVTFPLSFIA